MFLRGEVCSQCWRHGCWAAETVQWGVCNGSGGCRYQRWWAKLYNHRGWKFFAWRSSAATPVSQLSPCRIKQTTTQQLQLRKFQQEAEDASVLECTWTRSALEALRNALYKFKTYLLTYLLKTTGIRSRLHWTNWVQSVPRWCFSTCRGMPDVVYCATLRPACLQTTDALRPPLQTATGNRVSANLAHHKTLSQCNSSTHCVSYYY